MAQTVRDGQRSQRTNRVAKQRVRAVERINISMTVRGGAPASRLHGPGCLEGQFIQFAFPPVVRNASFAHQPVEIAIGADVVEAVVMNADVRHMRCHAVDRMISADLQKSLVAGRIKLKNGPTELKALGPLGPALGLILSLNGKDRRACLIVPRTVNR